jgi:hypothetical protein
LLASNTVSLLGHVFGSILLISHFLLFSINLLFFLIRQRWEDVEFQSRCFWNKSSILLYWFSLSGPSVFICFLVRCLSLVQQFRLNLLNNFLFERDWVIYMILFLNIVLIHPVNIRKSLAINLVVG